MRTGLLFGTFDGLHPGHMAMLREAAALVDQLTVVLPPDHVVLTLKGHLPKKNWEERAQMLRATGMALTILEGDDEPGQYSMLARLHPDMIFVGYDQNILAGDLERYLQKNTVSSKIYTLSPYHPERYKSSLFRHV